MSHVQNTMSPSMYQDPFGYDEANPQFHLTQDISQYLKAYARERPDILAMWCFGIGFVLGWKFRPW